MKQITQTFVESESQTIYTCREIMNIVMLLLARHPDTNIHRFFTNLLWASKKLKEINYPFIYSEFVGSNTNMTKVGFQNKILLLVWKYS